MSTWMERGADLIVKALETIASKVVTYDFARLMEGAKEKCSEFGDAIIRIWISLISEQEADVSVSPL